MNDKPPRSVRSGHSAAEDSWPAPPIDRRGIPGAGNPSAQVYVEPAAQRGEARLSWVWKVVGILAACVAFGWAGHATMAAWSANWQTVAGAEQDRDRIRKLEAEWEGERMKVHDLERDLMQLRKEFDFMQAHQPDKIATKRPPSRDP